MQLKDFRYDILFISSRKRNEKKDDKIDDYASLRTVGMMRQENLNLSSTESTHGNRNAKQIIMLTVKYLISIYIFSLKKNPTLFTEELEELKKFDLFSINHLENLTSEEEREVLEFQLMEKLWEVLQMKQADLLRKIPLKVFYSMEINSPVLLYLLYFLVSYGSGTVLIKDFDKIAEKSQEKAFNKAQFIFQTSVELYRDDMLLTMLLEPLAHKLTPIRLVEIYNNHLDYYNGLLETDAKYLSASVSGYDPIAKNNRVRNNLEDEIVLFPSEEAYEDAVFPQEILDLNKESKKKILRIIIDLFNLESSYDSLLEAIGRDYPHDISLLIPLYERLESRVPDQKPLHFNYTDKTAFRLMQEASSLSTKTHLVFNPRIISILKTLSNDLPDDNHPFVYLSRATI